MSHDTSAKHQGAANRAAPHRRPWTWSERRWEPDFRAPEIKLKPLDEVEARPFVWEGDARLPRGAVTIIAGEHGTGKSLLAIDWAARISRGETWSATCANEPVLPVGCGAATRAQDASGDSSTPGRAASLPAQHGESGAPARQQDGGPGAPARQRDQSSSAGRGRPDLHENGRGLPNLHENGRGRPDLHETPQPKNYGETVIAHAGDTTVELLRLRIDAAGAVPGRVASLALAWPEKGQRFNFDTINNRIYGLTCAIRGTSNVRLLVIDNLEAWAGNVQAAPSAALLNFLLTRLGELAALAGVAIVVLARLPHSGGQAAARKLEALCDAAPVVYLAAEDAERPGRKLLLPVKNNLASSAPAKAFEVVDDRVVWSDEPIEGAANEFIAPISRRREARHERESAARWLLAALADGPLESRELFRQARDCGFSTKTLRRAAESLGLSPRKTSFEGPWQWQLGEPEASASVSCGDAAAPGNPEAHASGSPMCDSGSPMCGSGASGGPGASESDAREATSDDADDGPNGQAPAADLPAEDGQACAMHNGRHDRNGRCAPCGV